MAQSFLLENRGPGAWSVHFEGVGVHGLCNEVNVINQTNKQAHWCSAEKDYQPRLSTSCIYVDQASAVQKRVFFRHN